VSMTSIFSVLFAIASALLWGWSAWVHLPVLGSGYGSLTSKMRDGTIETTAEPFFAAMKKIAKLNAAAALCAMLAAFFQAVSMLKP
jgi:hypothetical protein